MSKLTIDSIHKTPDISTKLRPVLFVAQVMSDISKQDCIHNKQIKFIHLTLAKFPYKFNYKLYQSLVNELYLNIPK